MKKSVKHHKYKMKGCSKTRKYGGVNLAYPSNTVHKIINPALAYTGKGGTGDIGFAYPATGPKPGGFNFINPQSQRGGGCGCGLKLFGGNKKHRRGCKCSICKMGMKGGQNNDALVGKNWTSDINTWGKTNHYADNTYSNDISRQMINTNANPPYSVGGLRKNKGGALSNLLSQDLINVGRQIQYGVNSSYNTLSGYAPPVNPLPWKQHL
jgi:hypothetical protein